MDSWPRPTYTLTRPSASRCWPACLAYASTIRSSWPSQVTSPWSRRHASPLLERRRERGAVPLRGTPGAPVRVADRDDVHVARGQTGPKGLPTPLRLVVIARAHFDTVRLPFRPVALQRAALAVGAPLGRALGYPEAVTRSLSRQHLGAGCRGGRMGPAAPTRSRLAAPIREGVRDGGPAPDRAARSAFDNHLATASRDRRRGRSRRCGRRRSLKPTTANGLPAGATTRPGGAVDDRRPGERRRTGLRAPAPSARPRRHRRTTAGSRAAAASLPRSTRKTTSGSSTASESLRSRRRGRRRERRRRRPAGRRCRSPARAPRRCTRRLRAARELTSRGRRASDDRGDLLERHPEHVVQDEGEALGRCQRLEHDEQREPDRVGQQRLVVRVAVRFDC